MSPKPFSARLNLPFAQLCAQTSQHSPYLRALMQRRADTVHDLENMVPEKLARQMGAKVQETALSQSKDELARSLRLAKADMHLLCALADIGGVWALEEVTDQLARFADAAMQAALAGAARDLLPGFETSEDAGPLPGLFVMAMGKYGAFELNYSSDIDFTFFFNPKKAADWLGKDPSRTLARLVRRLVYSIGAVTADGYVFRTDMRLRPDPASTNPAVSTPAARVYYESTGQNWERAALIKARPCAGDLETAAKFWTDLQPFIWRRSLDFAAIEDIHAMKRQIHVSLNESGFEAPGHDVKLGRGGIREIEFFVQTQQLVLGGREPSLRIPSTCDALAALAKAGHISQDISDQLCTCYRLLRRAEHGAQMLEDQQTHVLPKDNTKRAAIAALTGAPGLGSFDGQMQDIFRQVHGCYAQLFAHSEPLAAQIGSLVFTGVEDDPATLVTLREKGFQEPHIFLHRMRAWHGGSIRAMRSPRSRRLLTRLGPALVEALAKTGDADHAFAIFTQFFEALNAGVQPLSLFAARPAILDLLVALLNLAPRLAGAFSRQLSVLDAMLDPGFVTPLGEDLQAGAQRLKNCAGDAPDFETLLGDTRRAAMEERLRIAVQVLMLKASPEEAAESYSALANAAITALAKACFKQMHWRFGPVPGEWAILGMGSLGARQMDEGSDLDLMVIYRDPEKKPDSGHYYARFTRRLLGALSAQTREGALYTIDMKLRPSGRAGPVATSWPAFKSYYRQNAWTWELLALTRARVVCASSGDFAKTVSARIETVLGQERDIEKLRADIADMLKRLHEAFRGAPVWDLKHAPGGLLEALLLHQFLMFCGPAAARGNAKEAAHVLRDALGLQQSLLQILRLCLAHGALGPPFAAQVQDLLARARGESDFAALEQRLAKTQHQVRRLADQMLM